MIFAKFDLTDEAGNFLGGLRGQLKGKEFAELPAYVLVKMWLCVDSEFSHGNAEALSDQIKPIWPGVRYVVSSRGPCCRRKSPHGTCSDTSNEFERLPSAATHAAEWRTRRACLLGVCRSEVPIDRQCIIMVIKENHHTQCTHSPTWRQ